MNLTLSDEEWKPIDDWILRGWSINAIKAIREVLGVGIREAVDIFEERRGLLRESRPGEFVVEKILGQDAVESDGHQPSN